MPWLLIPLLFFLPGLTPRRAAALPPISEGAYPIADFAFDVACLCNPAPQLERITAPLPAINSADDPLNPPEFGILARETARVPAGEAVVLPISPLTRAHSTLGSQPLGPLPGAAPPSPMTR